MLGLVTFGIPERDLRDPFSDCSPEPFEDRREGRSADGLEFVLIPVVQWPQYRVIHLFHGVSFITSDRASLN